MRYGVRNNLLSSAAILTSLAIVATSVAQAADLAVVEPMFKPAVDAINGKLEGYGGWTDGTRGRDDSFKGGAVGALSLPIGERFGAQIDGLLGSDNKRFVYGAAGHFFARDPDSYLFGVYGSAVGMEKTSGAWGGKLGVEAEFYLGQFTVSGVVGVERINNLASRFNFRKKTSFFDYVDVSYYINDDFKVSVGHRYTGRSHAAAFGGEYRLPLAGADVSVFGEARIGENHYKTALGGVKIYFGAGTKSLKARQRESDPATHLRDDIFALGRATSGGGGANCTPGGGGGGVGTAAVAACPPPPPPPPCGCGGPCNYQ